MVMKMLLNTKSSMVYIPFIVLFSVLMFICIMLSVKFNVWRLGHFFMGRLEALPSQCRLAYG